MKFQNYVNGVRSLAVVTALILLYIGDFAAGWPVDWWVPVWALLSLDAVLSVAGFAFGGPFAATQLSGSEQYGEFISKERK